MHKNISLVALAVLGAMSVQAQAANGDFDNLLGATDISAADFTSFTTMDDFLAKHENGTAGFVAAKAGQYVVGNFQDGEVFTGNMHVYARNANDDITALYANGGTVTNRGLVKLVASDKDTGYKNEAMLADVGGTAVNAGTIAVVNAYGMRAGTTAAEGKANTMDNRGQLLVASGVGMELGAGAVKTVGLNSGLIVVDKYVAPQTETEEFAGDDEQPAKPVKPTIPVNPVDYAHGVLINGATDAAFTNTGTIEVKKGQGIVYKGTSKAAITNSGKILVDAENEGGAAISIESAGAILNLEAGSHIEGLVALFTDTTVNVNGVRGETLEFGMYNKETEQVLDATAPTITLTNADVTLDTAAEADGMTFGKVSFEDSVLGVAEGSKLTVSNLSAKSGEATFRLNEVSTTAPVTVTAVTAEDDQKVAINTVYSGKIADKVAAGEIEADALAGGAVKAPEQNAEQGTIKGEEGLVGGAFEVTGNAEDGYGVAQTANSITEANTSLALVNAHAWRTEITSITDRLSSIRTAPAQAGVWARWNGGSWDGDAMTLDFNTVEVGADKAITENVVFGASFNYTKGDGDFTNGSADTDTYAAAAYLSWFHEKGSFVDAVAKVGRIETDFSLQNTQGVRDNGDYSQTGFIFGIETGHRFALTDMFWLEPQVALSYSKLGDDTFTSDNRRIEMDSVESLVGRVGLMAGIECPNNQGGAYIRANYMHDFKGDVDASYSAGGVTTKTSTELDDNWGEVALGARWNVTPATTTFLDVAKGFGGDVDLDYRVNLGVRYAF